MWFEVEGFKEKVESWWKDFLFEGTASHVLRQNLKALATSIRRWNMEECGLMEEHKENCPKRIEALDVLEQVRELSTRKRAEREDSKKEYARWVRCEEIS